MLKTISFTPDVVSMMIDSESTSNLVMDSLNLYFERVYSKHNDKIYHRDTIMDDVRRIVALSLTKSEPQWKSVPIELFFNRESEDDLHFDLLVGLADSYYTMLSSNPGIIGPCHH